MNPDLRNALAKVRELESELQHARSRAEAAEHAAQRASKAAADAWAHCKLLLSAQRSRTQTDDGH